MLTRETLRKIRRIQIRTRVILESGIGGAYHAVFKGRGMEFAEVREYAPGDEVRTIDWNVTARMGAPYVKKFVEERDLTLLLVVDVSGSLEFGSQYLLKRDYAAELAAVLAFSAVANHDRVGAVAFSDRVEGYVPPGRGRDHALRIVRDLLAKEPAGRGTDIAGALRFASRVLRRRGIVAVISDFQAEGWERALGVLRRRHDVVALHLRDPREQELPQGGLVAFSDPETGGRFVADTSRPEVRRALRFASRVLRRRGIVAVISDFQAEGWERALGVLRRRHDVVALHLRDPREQELPKGGLVAFSDPETGGRFVVDTSRPEVRRALRAPAFATAQAVFRKTRVDALPLSTGESYERPLSAFFEARERRR